MRLAEVWGSGVWGLRAHLRSLVCCFCEPSEHDFDHGEFDEGDGAFDVSFIVSGEAAAVADPGECSFDDPSFGQRDEACLALRAFDDCEGGSADLGQSGGYFWRLIAAIGDEFCDRRMFLQRCLHDREGADPVLHAGGLDLQAQQHA